MDRKTFLKALPGLGLILLETRQAIAKALPDLLSQRGGDRLTIYAPEGGRRSELPVWWLHDVAYISAPKLAEALNYHTYFNENKRKLVIYLPQNKVVVTADNPYVLIDSRPLQMPIPAMWRKNEIYVPLLYLSPLLSNYTSVSMQYDRLEQVLRPTNMERPPLVRDIQPRLSGMQISERENGVVIRLGASRRFGDGEITLKMRGDWLHIELYKAIVDADQIRRTQKIKQIRDIKVIEFEELVSIGLRLRKKPLSREIYQEPDGGDIVAILRYKENIAGDNSASDGIGDQDMPADEQLQQQLDRERRRWLIDTVVIDPGHGGKDPGAIGAGRLKEKDVVLPVALKLGEIIRKKMPGVKVVYTRRDDRFIPLRRRTQIANENNGKVFISVHANANRNRNAKGFETYILGPEKGDQARSVVERENSVIQFEDAKNQRHYKGINTILATMAQSAFLKQSERLASNVQNNMNSRLRSLRMKNRGVKQAPFWVMVGASMPCILVEIGFVTNAGDARIIKTGSHQQKIAEGIFRGLEEYKRDYENAI